VYTDGVFILNETFYWLITPGGNFFKLLSGFPPGVKHVRPP